MILDTRQDPIQGAFGQYMTGPWARWFDALLAAGGGNVNIDVPRGRSNPHNQFRGYSTQPDYLTTGKTFRGRQTGPKVPAGTTYATAALQGLQKAGQDRNVARPELSHEDWMQLNPEAEGYWQGSKRRTYAPSKGKTGQSYMRIQGQRGGPRA